MTYTGVNSDSEDMASKVGTPVIYSTPTPASYAGAQTYTPNDILGSIIVHANATAVNGTLPTAALLASAIPNCRVGDTVECLIVNGGAGVITILVGTGGSFDANQGAGSQTIAVGNSKWVQLRMTNVAPGSQAYVVYA